MEEHETALGLGCGVFFSTNSISEADGKFNSSANVWASCYVNYSLV